jgi:hypothetical protein
LKTLQESIVNDLSNSVIGGLIVPASGIAAESPAEGMVLRGQVTMARMAARWAIA